VLFRSAVIFLEGDLGAGKTTLVRGLLRGRNYAGRVKSPTYTLVEPHVVSGLNLYHFDFYRFNSPDEYLEAGLDEYFAGDGICLVEWPDKAAPYLPAPDLCLHLRVVGNGRQLDVQARGSRGESCLNTWMNSASAAATSSASPRPA
jgi:tRNA threonylcarbamoyladenosine biosynthesis protein TsaE